MLLVAINAGNDLDRIKACLCKLFDINNVSVVYNSNINNNNLLEHFTLAAIAVMKYSTVNQHYSSSDILVPIITTIGSPSFDNLLKSHINRLDNDQLIFDTIQKNVKHNWFLSTTNSMIKACISSNKLNRLLLDVNKNLDKNYPPGDLFPLVWYAQRVGLKVYEAAK